MVRIGSLAEPGVDFAHGLHRVEVHDKKFVRALRDHVRARAKVDVGLLCRFDRRRCDRGGQFLRSSDVFGFDRGRIQRARTGGDEDARYCEKVEAVERVVVFAHRARWFAE